ncbi:MAG: hypothetical protein II487_03710 [Schwartzia sp.]|nr:hypothetical protein [Schwartzia sp. (in: firmicutes)]
MKDKIEQLSKGIMTYELPRIVLSEEKLSLAVESGKRRTVSVTIGNEAEMHMKGLVYSTNPKVTVASGQFSGSESLIEFSCNAEYAEVGSRIKGKLCFVTNCGEISLPYSFKVIAPVLISMEGPVINMVQFAALARSNQTEAKRLFLSSEFTVFAVHHEPDSLVIRERLLRSPSADIALEQFLIATGRKMKVQLETSEQQKSYNAGNTSFSDSIKIIKGNWGYVSLNASVSGGFIELETENISNDDFAGSEYELHYIIYPERMQPGINMANIVLTGCGMKKVIPITCRLPHADKEALGKQRMLDRLMIKAMENYIAYSLDQIPAGRYVSEARALIEQYESTIGEEKLELKLYKSQLLRLSGKESPALSLLNSVEKEELNNATVFAKGLYFFIMAQRKDESAADYAEQLYTLSDVNPENVYLSLLAYRLEKRYEKNLKAGFEELRKMFLSGSRSPIMYMYAARQLNAEPLLLKELDDFEVQVVNFSVKKGLLFHPDSSIKNRMKRDPTSGKRNRGGGGRTAHEKRTQKKTERRTGDPAGDPGAGGSDPAAFSGGKAGLSRTVEGPGANGRDCRPRCRAYNGADAGTDAGAHSGADPRTNPRAGPLYHPRGGERRACAAGGGLRHGEHRRAGEDPGGDPGRPGAGPAGRGRGGGLRPHGVILPGRQLEGHRVLSGRHDPGDPVEGDHRRQVLLLCRGEDRRPLSVPPQAGG